MLFRRLQRPSPQKPLRKNTASSARDAPLSSQEKTSARPHQNNEPSKTPPHSSLPPTTRLSSPLYCTALPTATQTSPAATPIYRHQSTSHPDLSSTNTRQTLCPQFPASKTAKCHPVSWPDKISSVHPAPLSNTRSSLLLGPNCQPRNFLIPCAEHKSQQNPNYQSRQKANCAIKQGH